MQTSRTCDGCTACCYTHAVPEKQKPLCVSCQSIVVGIGCAQYDSRPKSCREFGCAWLWGHGADDERPDITGIVCERVHLRMLGHAWQLVEQRADAIDSDFGRRQIDWGLAQGFYVDLRLQRRKRTILVPDGIRVPILARCMYEGEDTRILPLDRYRERLRQ